jgi:ParB family chromosome partitioning protein
MSPLGRGLASLIPKRKMDADELLERIDRMEVVEEEDEVMAVETTKTVAAKKQLRVTEELEEGAEDPLPPPGKPLVTPITIDPDMMVPSKAVPAKRAAPTPEKAETIIVEDDDDAEETIVTPTEPEEEVETEAPPVIPAAPVEVEEAANEPVEADEVATKEAVPAAWEKHEEKIQHIPIGDIQTNPLQPRTSFDPVGLDELAHSIQQYGILQPLVVRRLEDGKGYELIAGERRLRAAKQLGWERVPCVVRSDVKSDRSRLELALLENIQRKDLNPIDEALAYKKLTDEYGMSQDEIAARLGKSRVAVTNSVRMLALPAEIQRGLIDGKITSGHARTILMIPDTEKQMKFYQHIVDEGLTVRKAEVRARRIQRAMRVYGPGHLKSSRTLMARTYSVPLEQKYGFSTKVRYDEPKNKFEIVFIAHNEGELKELVARLMNEGQTNEIEEI